MKRKKILYLLAFSLLLSSIFINYDVAQMKGKPALNKKKVILTVGKTTKLKLKNYKKKVKWTSSNRKAASVSQKGLVKAKKAGKARITAKAGKKKYVCQVTVRAKAVANNSQSSKNNNKNNDSQTVDVSTYPEQVLQLVNAERKKAGVELLQLDESLCKVAGIRAEETTKLFSHTRPDGSSCFSILQEYNISCRAVGENIAAGQKTPEFVMNAWMNSEGHRANILSEDFHKLGVGYAKVSSGYGHYWVQMFSD